MTTQVLRTYARANQGSVIVPFILGGAMGPVTNAGAIAQSIGEAMVGCALTQLERPGAPCILGNFLSSTALKSGSPTFGTPEPAVGTLVIGQLVPRLAIPLRCSAPPTTSQLPDPHATAPRLTSILPAAPPAAHLPSHSLRSLDRPLSTSTATSIPPLHASAPHAA